MRLGRRGILLLAGLAVLLLTGIAIPVAVSVLHATSSPAIGVNPASQTEFWYKPTPMTFTINASGLSGTGLGDASGYQYALQWNPAVLQWLSGPQVGPGTPTPAPVLPCSNDPYLITWGSPTATPTNLVPTYTPTYTNTPAAGTPSNTPTVTNTPTQTPTPGGYVLVGCATISGTAVPSGVLGTFQFQPLVLGTATSPLNLRDVKLVDHNGTPIPVTATSGRASLVECHDLDHDGVITILDVSLLAKHYLATPTNPVPPGWTWDPTYDLDGDQSITILDLSVLAGTYQMRC